MIIPLKAKYRTPGGVIHSHMPGEPAEGTLVYKAGRFKSKSSNSGKKQLAKQGQGHRRRQGWGFTNPLNYQ